MRSKSRKAAVASLAMVFALATAGFATAAQAAQVVVNVGTTLTATGQQITFDSSTFSFFGTGDIFNPVAVQTSGGAAFRTILGGVSTDFPGRGSGILIYGPSLTYSAIPTKTTVSFSNGDNYFGLRATLNGQNFYGYAFTTDNVLNSYGYQTTPDTAFVIDTNPPAVPEPASWALMIVGFGAVGGAVRRRRAAVALA